MEMKFKNAQALINRNVSSIKFHKEEKWLQFAQISLKSNDIKCVQLIPFSF